MAHVYGHCDFFKNNVWFSQTNRKMMDQMANHGNRIRRYMDRFGVEEVEKFIDCLPEHRGPDRHPFAVHQAARRAATSYDLKPRPTRTSRLRPGRFHAKGYMDSFINPPRCLAAEADAGRSRSATQEKQFPAEPIRDVMLFLLEHAPLKPWQLDVLSILRDEAYYFAPQAQTKIMNEGWASYWHSTIMTRQGLIAGRRDPLLRPSLGHDGQLARPAESVQAGDRAVPRHRRALEPRPIRQRIRRVRRPGRQAATGTATPGWAGRRSSKSAGSTTI